MKVTKKYIKPETDIQVIILDNYILAGSTKNPYTQEEEEEEGEGGARSIEWDEEE